MVLHVCERSAEAVGRDGVIVATDSDEIADVVRGAGFESIIIDSPCETGTDRVAEAARNLGFQKVINVQGDEPLIDPQLITDVAVTLAESGDVVNAYTQMQSDENVLSRSIPKVVLSETDFLIYSSRAAIPSGKEEVQEEGGFLKQVSVYGFSIDHLKIFGSGRRKSRNEQREDIEILRFLDAGIPVRMVSATGPLSVAVDHPEDIDVVNQILTQNQI